MTAEESAVPGASLIRLRLDLAYDGTDFHGWASQPGLRTVQGETQEALRVALRLAETPELTVAGRTDVGVHARGQVAHADVPCAAWAAGRGDGAAAAAPAAASGHPAAGDRPGARQL